MAEDNEPAALLRHPGRTKPPFPPGLGTATPGDSPTRLPPRTSCGAQPAFSPGPSRAARLVENGRPPPPPSLPGLPEVSSAPSWLEFTSFLLSLAAGADMLL